jgi:DNA polymerase III subunit beta
MNNCTISVQANHFAAAIHSAAKQDIRYYLNGVYVEATEDETRCISTDGYGVIALRADSVNGMGGTNLIDLIVPRDVVERVVKATKGKGQISLQRTDGHWSVVTTVGTFPFAPVDGRFPQYRSVIPHSPSGELGQFDPELLIRFTKAAKALGFKGSPEITHNGTSGALVTLDGMGEFLGVVMPFRIQKRVGVDVSWGAGPLKGYQPNLKVAA